MSTFSTSAGLEQNYDEYYKGASEWRRLGAIDKTSNILEMCKGYPHQSVLDVGAGEGSILERLSEFNFGDELYALEISTSGVEAIKNRNIRSLVECRKFDGYSIPYTDGKFDLAILSHVIEHVEHPRKLLYETARVADYLFIEVPLEDTIRMPRNYKATKTGHINFYSPKTIRRLAQTCGLEVIAQRVVNPCLQVYQYKGGKKGTLNYCIKEGALRFFPKIASQIWTYHSALLCRKSSAHDVDDSPL